MVKSSKMADKTRYIAHIDMDAFFTSVEQRDNPEIKGKPVIVGSDPKGGKGRGVVAACSYEARTFGIHSAMPISIAYRKCPQAIFLPGDMRKYAEESHKILDILERFTPDVEPISIDEAFLDITGSYHHFGTPLETCRKIKSAIKKETGLTASLGLAPNKMTAKIASDIGKPDGFVAVTQDKLLQFLHPLPVGKLWGIGEKTVKILKDMGINTIGDLAERTPEELIRVFGKNGKHAWDLANGIDPRDVSIDDTIRSVSNEHTFEQNTADEQEIRNVLMRLSEKVSRRLRQAALQGRTITLKIRFADFKTHTCAVTISMPTNFTDIIYKNIVNKLLDFDLDEKPVRLVGVGVSNFSDPSWKNDLFIDEAKTVKKENLYKTLDKIIDKFGEGKLRRRT